jgi:DNA processing protein
MKHQFPIRDRIIAGLTPAVLVIEAREKSGSLITPRLALESNRDVFAIPGGIYSPGSVGTNNLIKQGAKAITSYQEILDELGLTKTKECTNNKSIASASDEEKTILSWLGTEPLHIDSLAKKTQNNASTISSTLTLMEIKGMIKNLGGGNYAAIR